MGSLFDLGSADTKLAHREICGYTSYTLVLLSELEFKSLCIYGMADFDSLSVLAGVTKKGSGFLVFSLNSLVGNMAAFLSLFVHFREKFKQSFVLLAVSVSRPVRLRASS